MKTNINGSSLRATTGKRPVRSALPTTSDLTALLQHGGIYGLADADGMKKRMKRMKHIHIHRFREVDTDALAEQIAETAQYVFYNLVENKPYPINSSLISYLTLYQDGRLFPKHGEIQPNKKVASFLTFVGQFIDHDLTLNMIDLIGTDPDPSQVIADKASPLIDLDSVYGTRDVLVTGSMWDVLDNTTGTFKLREISENGNIIGYDLPRVSRDATVDGQMHVKGQAYIFDKRNDENQIILQIHVLVMRLHNKLAAQGQWKTKIDPNDPETVIGFIDEVRVEVVRIWQSVIWNHYLPTVIAPEPVAWAKQQAMKPLTRPLGMPNEFSIGFRMGHSQLRPSYLLNEKNKQANAPIVLFDNTTATPDDLRGSVPLQTDHVIEWDFFIDSRRSEQFSNLIDDIVTSKVFNLPESTIPDDVKGVGNLPQRNLMRSRQLDLSWGEEVVKFYNCTYGLHIPVLTPDEIEPDKEKQKLFRLDDDGFYAPDNEFRTPLWYYILKEAQIENSGGEQLGSLGGRIIGEVIAVAIDRQPDCFFKDSSWVPMIPTVNHGTDPQKVCFVDIVNYVLAMNIPAKPDCSLV